MVRVLRLLTAAAIAAGMLAPAAPAAASSCALPGTDVGTCASAGGGGVDLTGTTTSTRPGAGATPGGDSDDPVRFAYPLPTFDVLTDCTGDCVDTWGGLVDFGDPRPARPGTPAATITIGDVARLLVDRGTLHSEPDGWGVVGTPTNFWVDAQTSVARGTLLGKAVEVRFSPVAYHWVFGDGHTATTSTPGASWAALGQNPLSATATSHVYTERIAASTDVVVAYTAQYRVGGGTWTAVTGAVRASTPDVDVRVVTEATALTTGAGDPGF